MCNYGAFSLNLAIHFTYSNMANMSGLGIKTLKTNGTPDKISFYGQKTCFWDIGVLLVLKELMEFIKCLTPVIRISEG